MRLGWGSSRRHRRYITKKVLFEGTLKVNALSFLFIEDSEDSGEKCQVDPLVERVIFPVDAAVDDILSLSSADVGGEIGDGNSGVGAEGVPDQAVLLLLSKGFFTLTIGFFAVSIGFDGIIDEMFATPGDPAQIDDEFAVRGVGFVGVFTPEVCISVGAVDDEGS